MRMHDRATIDASAMTGEGYLRVAARLARTGVQEYWGYEIGAPESGRTYRVYRPAAEVFHADALASFEHKPITNEHPHEGVSATNWRKEAVGIVIGRPREANDHVVADLLITDAEATNRVQRDGGSELSCGYSCEIVWEGGLTPTGELYDCYQKDIRGNHVAIVERGRCGPTCAAGADSATVDATGGPRIVMLKASADSQRALRAWALAAGFDLTATHGGRTINADDLGFHSTLLASRNAIPLPTGEHEIKPFEARITGFDALGPDRTTPVLSLAADSFLGQLRSFFVDVYGAEPTYADFAPHVSLSYAWSGAPALDGLTAPDFPIVFDRFVVDDFRHADGAPDQPGGPVQVSDCSGVSPCKCPRTPPNEGTSDMATKTVTIGGKSFEVSADVADAITANDRAAADKSAADKAAGEAAAAIAARDAEIAALKAAAPTADQVAAMVADHVKVATDAKRLAPDLKTDGLGIPAVKRAAVAAHLGDRAGDLASRSDEYVSAMFDTLLGALPTGVDPIVAAVRGGSTADAKVNPRDAHLASLQKAWAA